VANPIKFFFLVAGHEFSNKGLDFDRMCTRRVAEWLFKLREGVRTKATDLPVTPPVTLRFLRFHFSKGAIEVIDHDLDAAGGKIVALGESSWKPLPSITSGGGDDPNTFCTKRALRAIKPSDYEDHEFIDGPDADRPEQVMSIVDVYDAVQLMPRKSLIELSFFSHGFPGGPVLVNTMDRSHNAARDQNDKDGRADKDFTKDMGDGSGDPDLELFNGAFDPNGFIQAWGCLAIRSVRHVVFEAYVKRKQGSDAVAKAMQAGKPIDDVESFAFDFSDVDHSGSKTIPWTLDYADDTNFFPPDQSTKTFSRTFRQIKQFIAGQNKGSYIFAAAKATEVLCKGAFAGMEGDDEKTKKFNLMRVCIKSTKDGIECPVSHAASLQFYRTYLGLEHDPERGYGIFDPAAVTTIEMWAGP
jgi:hypothetical protein